MMFREGKEVVWRDGMYGVYASTNQIRDRVSYQPCKFWVDDEGVERCSALLTADFIGFKEPRKWMFWRDSMHEAACKAIESVKNIKKHNKKNNEEKRKILSLAKEEAKGC